MREVSVEKVYIEDLECFKNLFYDNLSYIPWGDYVKMFTVRDPNIEDKFVGIGLKKNDVWVGFVGMIRAMRWLNGTKVATANMTTFVIEEKSRQDGWQFFMAMSEFSDLILTALSPMPITVKLLSMFNSGAVQSRHFQLIETQAPYDYFCGVVNDDSALHSILRGEELDIYNYHKGGKCINMLFRNNYEHCYVILKVNNIEEQNYMEVIYFSNESFFVKSISAIYHIVSDLYVFDGLVIDEFDAPEIMKSSAKKIAMKEPRMIFGEQSKNKKFPFMCLYSERMFLDI
ncbi:hypothetical protein PSECIP111951_04077 [Pseudoalteromonas holothuriae]|uniref:Uncharacterized protein n=1 Tax=Pseudoalteromonas holothuriae TaxID=2963714 RepID=A0A9W4R5A3_9GAMM|nr:MULTISPECIES: hypothetical protein [unclassified Pseudoalteromonas]CAH9067169.1 hypothetical protein PSECIP111854_04037 [Pseudoalteromonas sp. CIP111854]CAH9068226.1 hypothetical protein PSECIP111951_04077 [Pseudoalteromonas sp. CIP111951]